MSRPTLLLPWVFWRNIMNVSKIRTVFNIKLLSRILEKLYWSWLFLKLTCTFVTFPKLDTFNFWIIWAFVWSEANYQKKLWWKENLIHFAKNWMSYFLKLEASKSLLTFCRVRNPNWRAHKLAQKLPKIQNLAIKTSCWQYLGNIE